MPWPRGTSMSPNETLHMSNKYVTVWFFFVVLSSIVLTIVRSIQQTPRVSWAYQPNKHARMASKRVFNETHTRKKSQRRAIKIEIMYCQQSLTLWIFARIGANRNGAKIQRFFLFVSCAGKWAAIAVKKRAKPTRMNALIKCSVYSKGIWNEALIWWKCKRRTYWRWFLPHQAKWGGFGARIIYNIYPMKINDKWRGRN